MPNYRAVKDGEEVLNVTTADYQGLEPFGEHRERPESGRVELYVDDELIAVQEPLDEVAERAALDAQSAAQPSVVPNQEV